MNNFEVSIDGVSQIWNLETKTPSVRYPIDKFQFFNNFIEVKGDTYKHYISNDEIKLINIDDETITILFKNDKFNGKIEIYNQAEVSEKHLIEKLEALWKKLTNQ